MITIKLNGKEHALDKPLGLLELLDSIGLANKPVVVEHNQVALFPREYSETMINGGDQLEIITIAAGG